MNGDIKSAIQRHWKTVAGIGLVVAIVMAGVAAPQVIWPRESAAAAVAAARNFDKESIRIGNTRSLCKARSSTHIFGYKLSVNFESREGAAGYICRDVWQGQWRWRFDPPYEHWSSD